MTTVDSESNSQHIAAGTEAAAGSEASTNDGKNKTKSVFRSGRFWNPWDTWVEDEPFFSSGMRMIIKDKNNARIPSQAILDESLPLVKPDLSQLSNPPTSGIRVTWIGHATVLVQFDGISILTDPIFTDRCGPTSWLGVKRYRVAPLKVDELPKIDAVVISHSHFDHLSHPTVCELNKKFGKGLHWFVPLKLGDWMKAEGCETVTELDWWEEAHMDGYPGGVTFVFTPTQHLSQRTAFDKYKVLWGSWVVKGPNHSFYFAGDTAYCRAFKEIGQHYGPFDVAAIPVGATEPRWFKKNRHCSVAEAVQIHQDVRAKKSLGIHWGTFKLGYEYYLAPLTEVQECLEEAGLPPEDFCTKKHGEIWYIGEQPE